MKEKLFINGGKKVRDKEFAYSAPIGEEERKAVDEVLRSKTLSGFYKDFLGGEKVRGFEKAFAEYTGVKHAISLNSGTSALHVALAACGIGPGDEVIVPPYTFTATATSVLMNNAIPVFADVERDTLCIDPKKIRDMITKKTKAIMPVHLYGKIAKIEEIKEIVAGKEIFIIEDACQAPGCVYKGRKTGNLGDIAAFSFVETKNMVIGEGGMLTTNDDGIAERCRLIRNHGEVWVKGKPRQYLSNMLGFNFRMLEITAALGIAQLKKLEFLNGIRKKNADFLRRNLGNAGFEGIETIKFEEGEICHIFPIIFDEKKIGITRKKFMDILNSEGIPAVTGYSHPLYRNPIFLEKIAYGKRGCPYSCPLYGDKIDYTGVRCEIAEDICEKLICIKEVYYPYGTDDMKDIISSFVKIFSNMDKLK